MKACKISLSFSSRKSDSAGFVVGTVKEALVALEKQKFDLIFLDLKLPDGPADDVYDMAKTEQPECPIIIITGYPDSEMLNRILAKGPITVLEESRSKLSSSRKRSAFSATKTRSSWRPDLRLVRGIPLYATAQP